MQCLYVPGTMTECPFRRSVHLWEVSIGGGSTVCMLNQSICFFNIAAHYDPCKNCKLQVYFIKKNNINL